MSNRREELSFPQFFELSYMSLNLRSPKNLSDLAYLQKLFF